MRLSRAALLAPLILVGTDSASEVRVEAGRVTVHAAATPLTEVLSRFSEATGTKVVYESARPRQLVSVDIDAASEVEALSRLLEGQGLDYALRLDKSGRRVEMLLITGRSGRSARSRPGPGVPAPGAVEPEPGPEPAQLDPGQEPEAPVTSEPAESAPEAPETGDSAGAPAILQLPGAPLAPGAVAAPPPTGVGWSSPPLGPAPLGTTAPQPPSPASYPAPSYPTPVSHPEPQY